MASITECKRILKRIMLSNLTTDNESLFLTPMLSGKHGIGKSQIVKQAIHDIGGTCIAIEGGTLKEGEITGLPYQYEKDGKMSFKFLPYYAIEMIQKQEKEYEQQFNCTNISTEQKIELLKNGQIKPIVLFIDELNRTDNAVYRELMNIVLTKTVNGYVLPWWVFFVTAVNPSSQDSMYATNEMDPAQLDRFIKIKIEENTPDFINYAINKKFDKTLVDFIANNEIYLSNYEDNLSDTENCTPSPRSWEMINIILKSKNIIEDFFTKQELKEEEHDIKTIIFSKVGASAATAYYSSLEDKNNTKLVISSDIYNFNIKGIETNILKLLKKQSTAKNSITNRNMIDDLIKNFDEYKRKNYQDLLDKTKEYLNALDSSSKLVFMQYLSSNVTVENTSLYEEFYQIFDKETIKLVTNNLDNGSIIVNE